MGRVILSSQRYDNALGLNREKTKDFETKKEMPGEESPNELSLFLNTVPGWVMAVSFPSFKGSCLLGWVAVASP